MLKICNLYPKKLWVTIMYFEPGCAVDHPGSEVWERKGWWSLVPGQCKIVFGEDLADVNRYYCYFAQATDSAIWAGPYKRWVINPPFELCSGAGLTGPTKFIVGYRLLDIGDNDDFTLMLKA